MLKQLTRLTLLQALLKINHMQCRNSNFENNFSGAPPDEKKLWKQLRKDIMPALQRAAKTQWFRIKSFGVSLPVFRHKPVIPSKKFLITLTGIPASMSIAKRCIASAKQYGEDRNLEILPAVNQSESQDFFIRHNLTWCWKLQGFDPLAQMGCFASHFKLWLRCMDIGKPILVLEHDAVFRAPIPTLKFSHVIMLGLPNLETSRVNSKVLATCKKGTIYYPKSHLLGTHAYMITPEGAHRLVKAAKEELLFPVDHFIRKELVSILYCNPCPIKLNTSWISSISTPRATRKNFDALWKNYKYTPVRDQSRSTRR